MLGCLLYELCSLEKPFSGDSISVIMNKILKEEPKNLPIIYSQFIQNLTSSLLSKNQQKRPEIEEILALKEIKIEIKSLIANFPKNYQHLEEIYCKDMRFLHAKAPAEYKKKSLIKPLSYSVLPNLQEKEENKEKIFTPKVSENNDKNSILNVIKNQAKKQTFFSNFERKDQDQEKKPEEFINETPDSNDKSDSLEKNINRVSFNQYLNKKLIVDKNDDDSNSMIIVHKEKTEGFIAKKKPSNILEISAVKKARNLEIIAEKTPIGGSAKLNFDDEEKKGNFISNRMISPTNFGKLKRNSPKGNVIDKLITSTEGTGGVSSQRSRLFVEFLKERLGEEKFEKVKAIIQGDDSFLGTSIIEKKRNEILEVIGIKNAEVLKYLGVLCIDNGEKRKNTVEIEGKEKEEGRTERISSGNGKIEGFNKK